MLPGQLPDLFDPREVAVALDGPAVVRSGHTLHHHLIVHNLTDSELCQRRPNFPPSPTPSAAEQGANSPMILED
jgi:hypothetical protein